MVVKETLVICNDCGDNGSGGDDRDKTATEIRRSRKAYGWIQRGSKDYCDQCAPKHQKSNGGLTRAATETEGEDERTN